MTPVLVWTFWGSVALIVWVHVAFPALLLLRARLRPRPLQAGEVRSGVTVVLAAHDEAGVIGRRIQNLLDQDLPPDRLHVVVAVDGRDDDTYERAAALASDQVEVLGLPRVGKAAAMNAALARVRHDIVAFTDANSHWEPGALRALLAPFADPRVGATAGDQRYTGRDRTDPVAGGEAAHWSLDRVLKQAQSQAGSVTSATGAIHAVRREFVDQVPLGVTDDFYLSTGAVRAGRRLVFVPEARAFENLAPSREAEFARKVRIMTRGLRAVVARRELLDPRRHGFYALQLFTHKVLRRLLFVPVLLIAVTSVVGAPAVAYLGVAAVLQGLFYLLALVGLLLPRRGGGRVAQVMRLPAFFCLVYAAAAVATVRVLRGGEVQRWGHERLEEPVVDRPGRAG